MVYTCIDWFLQAVSNICNTFYSLLTTELDLSVVGLGHVNLIFVILGSGLLVLIIYKLIQWIIPVV